MKSLRLILSLAILALLGAGCSADKKTVYVQAESTSGQSAQPTTAVEGCIGCHGTTGALPVADVTSTSDAHYVDTDADGPLTDSGYRKLNVTITAVDVTSSSVVIDFSVTDENGAAVSDLVRSDGRFTIAQLLPPPSTGDGNQWMSLMTTTEDPGSVGTGDGSLETQATYERFSSSGFQNLGSGSYRYTSTFDPTSVPILSGDTIRVALQISAGDLPTGNGWCDFDANLASANDCVSAVSLTRDIVQTAVCNGCHGATSDVKLALHGGGRTDIEYCVTCHNPYTKDANSDNVLSLTSMIHKIHRGSSLSTTYQIWGHNDSLHDYSNVSFTKEIDNCTNCHTGGGTDVNNWNLVPTMEACGSCHDDVDFATGANHPAPGGVQTSNVSCAFCHTSSGVWNGGTSLPVPIQTVHQGVARRTEANLYTGSSNGYAIVATAYNTSTRALTVDFSVTRNGTAMDLASASEWTAGGGASRLALIVAWATSDYTNEGGSAPASAMSINALDIGGAVTDMGGGVYRAVATLPSTVSDTVTVALEGHPAADLVSLGTYNQRIPVVTAIEHVSVSGSRGVATPRRIVVDITKCNKCHDAAGQGISLHGSNRTGTSIVCAMCHNANNTDITRRPSDPTTTPDGKAEETIDFKRMIHQIHNGAELEDGLYIYGYGSSLHDFSHVEFIGNLKNCETCHLAGTYGATKANDTLPTTIDTGDDLSDPDDDLNISPVAAVCSSCHDDDAAIGHMEKFGASFSVLDADVH